MRTERPLHFSVKSIVPSSRNAMSQGFSRPSSTTSCCRLLLFMPDWAKAAPASAVVPARAAATQGVIFSTLRLDILSSQMIASSPDPSSMLPCPAAACLDGPRGPCITARPSCSSNTWRPRRGRGGHVALFEGLDDVAHDVRDVRVREIGRHRRHQRRVRADPFAGAVSVQPFAEVRGVVARQLGESWPCPWRSARGSSGSCPDRGPRPPRCPAPRPPPRGRCSPGSPQPPR